MQDAAVTSEPNSYSNVRLREANRSLTDPYPKSIDELIPQDHAARDAWELTGQLDYGPLLSEVKAVVGKPGGPATDPRILTCLWIYATIQGISSARRLAKLTVEHDAYKWIAGGVSINYHTLSEFRTKHNGWLEHQVVAVVAALKEEGLVDLKEVAQDGMRVRASAGSDSFKKKEKLQEHLAAAKAQWDQMQEQFESGQEELPSKQQAAQLRAARERVERLERAKEEVAQISAAREERKSGDGQTARASMTDPEARKMKMSDGGYRPAYNFQFATLLSTLLIVGVDVVSNSADGGLMSPMVTQIERNFGERPESCIADGGYTTKGDIEVLSQLGIKVLVPVKGAEKELARGKDPYQAKPRDTAAIGDWRTRMGTEEAKQQYSQRSKCEWSNAEARRHGITQLTVRGRAKAKAVALWHALTQNLLRADALRAEAASKA